MKGNRGGEGELTLVAGVQAVRRESPTGRTAARATWTSDGDAASGAHLAQGRGFSFIYFCFIFLFICFLFNVLFNLHIILV